MRRTVRSWMLNVARVAAQFVCRQIDVGRARAVFSPSIGHVRT